MEQRYAYAALTPNRVGGANVGISRQGCRSIDAIRDTARRLWPQKTASELSLRTGASIRQCERWLAGQCGMTDDMMAALLRSDVGLDVLEGVMGDGRPIWWRDFRRKVEIGKIIREQDELERRLDALKRE